MVDAEETVWAPRLGLRGVVDAVAVGKLESGAFAESGANPSAAPARPSISSGIVPVELKTGYWRSPVEHGAQLSLYTLMLAERYRQRVPFGLLHYTRHPGGSAGPGASGAASRNKKDDETLAIRPGKRDLAFLMLRRNALAGALNPNRGGAVAEAAFLRERNFVAGADDAEPSPSPSSPSKAAGVPFALGALPPMEQCRSECERCFVRDACLTVNAALEGGAERCSDPAVAALARETVGHITPALARELARWLGLVDAEAAASAARRATPWMPVEDVRRRGAFAVAGLKMAPSKTSASAEGAGGNVSASRRYDLSEDEDVPRAGEARSDGSGGQAPRRREGVGCCEERRQTKELHGPKLALGNACFVLSCAASDVARPLLLLQEHEVRCCVRAASGRRARISAQVRCVSPKWTAAARPVLAIDSWSAYSSQSVEREAVRKCKMVGFGRRRPGVVRFARVR